MWWRLAGVVVGLVGLTVALWRERFGLALVWFLVALGLAWLEGRAKNTARAEAEAAAARAGSAAPSATSLTLWAANEQTARQLVEDPYFLQGVLLSDAGEAGAAFRDALGQGGRITSMTMPNLTRGGFDVKMTVLKADRSAGHGT